MESELILGLIYSKFDPNIYFDQRPESELLINATVNCYVGSKLHYSQSVNAGTPFLGKREDGYLLIRYKVPEDLPLEEAINCEFSAKNFDMDFIRKYGDVKIFVRKFSDK